MRPSDFYLPKNRAQNFFETNDANFATRRIENNGQRLAGTLQPAQGFFDDDMIADIERRGYAFPDGPGAFRFVAVAAYLVALTIVGLLGRNPGGAGPVLIVPVSGALSAVIVWRLSVPPNRRLSFGSFASPFTTSHVPSSLPLSST